MRFHGQNRPEPFIRWLGWRRQPMDVQNDKKKGKRRCNDAQICAICESFYATSNVTKVRLFCLPDQAILCQTVAVT